MLVQSKSRLDSSKFYQCFNQQDSSCVIYDCESFTKFKFDVNNVNTVESTTYQECVFKSNGIFRTERSEINQLQKVIVYKPNEQSTKYLN